MRCLLYADNEALRKVPGGLLLLPAAPGVGESLARAVTCPLLLSRHLRKLILLFSSGPATSTSAGKPSTPSSSHPSRASSRTTQNPTRPSSLPPPSPRSPSLRRRPPHRSTLAPPPCPTPRPLSTDLRRAHPTPLPLSRPSGPKSTLSTPRARARFLSAGTSGAGTRMADVGRV
mgnify:FL=1